MTVRPELEQEVTNLVNKMSDLEKVSAGITVALLHMDKLERGQRIDLIEAGLDFYRCAMAADLLTFVTKDCTLLAHTQEATREVQVRVAMTLKTAIETQEATKDRFFLLTEMLKDKP